MSEKKSYVERYLEDLKRALESLDTDVIDTAITWLKEARDSGRMVYICGNGGSASIASQMVVDINKGASYGRKSRFKMIGLTDSIATITAYANDVDYDCVFAEQLKNFAEAGDILIAISGSGNSPNVIKAVEYANSAGVKTIGVTKRRGGKLRELSNLPLLVDSDHMGNLEDGFFVITHILCYAFMEDAEY